MTMHRLVCGLVCWTTLFVTAIGAAAELSLEPLAEPAPTDELAPEIAGQLSPTGVRIKSGTRTLCDVWLVKQCQTRADFKPTNSLKYPLEMGQLIGVARYGRKGGDFRGQDIEKGVYTLRYALQPEDGNHVGTSDTLDFLLLLKAEVDRAPATLAKDALFKHSAAAAGTTHPCMLSLLAPEAPAAATALEHDEQREWWIVNFLGQNAANKPMALRVVVDGKAAE